MQRRIPLAVGEYYHVYNRGVEKRDIFWDDRDYRRFLALLYLCNGTDTVHMQKLRTENSSYQDIFSVERSEPLVAIGAFCLMPNHFHLLIKEMRDGGISLFMKKLLTAYAMYANKRHDRSGVLFQGRFRSEYVGTDNYFRYIYAYIHLNPIKLIDPEWKENGLQSVSAAAAYLDKYPYSSYASYLGKNFPEASILDKTEFPNFFIGKESFEKFHRYWLSYRNSVKDRP